MVIVIAVVSNVWAKAREDRNDDEPATPTTRPEVRTPLVDPVRRDSLRAAAEARRRLSEAEEQVRGAEEDWNYARAQFGSAATEQYGRRLEAAKDAIARGLDTYEQIELTPDAHTKRRLASTITADLDKNLPPVQDNPERAAALLESARAALETVGAHLDTDPTRTASALDTAQRALSMANAPTDAIFSAKTDLDTSREKLAASIGSVSQSLSDAKNLDSAAASFAPLLDEAEVAISRGQRALVSDEDPLQASAAASRATTLAERAIGAPGRR